MADSRGSRTVNIADPTTGTQQAGVDASNHLQCDIAASSATVTVDNGGTFATQVDGAALTALQLIDNPVATIGTTDLFRVAIFDASDTQITSFGGGTEYTEDAPAAADPVGGALILVREDARAGSLTSTDGDNVAARGNNSGELYVIDTDAVALLTTIDTDTSTIAGDTTSIDGKITACDTGAVVISSGTITTVSTVTNLAQLGGTAISMNTGTRDAGTQRVTIATDDSVPTTVAGPTNPAIDITNITTPVTIAAGANSDMDTADLASKYFYQIDVAGSAPFKAIFYTLADAVATAVGVAFGDAFNSVSWKPAHPSFTQSGSGVGADGFRVNVTNLDEANTVDFYMSAQYADD